MFYIDQWPVFQDIRIQKFPVSRDPIQSQSQWFIIILATADTERQPIMLEWSRDSEGNSELTIIQLILPYKISKFCLKKLLDPLTIPGMASEPWATSCLRGLGESHFADYPPLVSSRRTEKAESVETNCCKFGRCAWLIVRETQAESTCNILSSLARGITQTFVLSF